MIVRSGLALLAVVASLGAAREARTPAPPQIAPPAPAALGCWREGRFLDLDAALCTEVGGARRPRGEEMIDEPPRPRPVLRLRGETLSPL